MSEKRDHVCTYEDCGKTFSRPYRLEEHMRSHSGERPFMCDFTGCNKSFRRLAHMKRHLDKSHKGSAVESIQCDFCEKWFASKQKLNLHVSNTHQRSPSYKCSNKACDESFRKKHQLVQHLHTAHNSGLPLRCDEEGCEKSFAQKSHLTRHRMNHHKGYACTEAGCQEIFSKWTLLRKHKATQHKPEYRCLECSKVFHQKNKFTQHQGSHDDNRPRLSCPHPACSRTYLDKRNLNAHFRVYHQDGKFTCELESCGKSFVTKQKLEAHKQLIHRSPSTSSKKKRRRNRFLAAKLSGFPNKIVPRDDITVLDETDEEVTPVHGSVSRCSLDSGLGEGPTQGEESKYGEDLPLQTVPVVRKESASMIPLGDGQVSWSSSMDTGFMSGDAESGCDGDGGKDDFKTHKEERSSCTVNDGKLMKVSPIKQTCDTSVHMIEESVNIHTFEATACREASRQHLSSTDTCQQVPVGCFQEIMVDTSLTNGNIFVERLNWNIGQPEDSLVIKSHTSAQQDEKASFEGLSSSQQIIVMADIHNPSSPSKMAASRDDRELETEAAHEWFVKL